MSIVGLADRPRASVIVGQVQRFGIPTHRIAPRLAGWLTTRVMNRVAVQPEPAPDTSGTVFEPRPEVERRQRRMAPQEED